MSRPLPTRPLPTYYVWCPVLHGTTRADARRIEARCAAHAAEKFAEEDDVRGADYIFAKGCDYPVHVTSGTTFDTQVFTILRRDGGALPRSGVAMTALRYCGKCGEAGHFTKTCGKPQQRRAYRNTGTGRGKGLCGYCRTPGHRINVCPKRLRDGVPIAEVIDTYFAATHQEIATELGVSCTRVQQILASATDKLRRDPRVLRLFLDTVRG